MVHVSRPRPIRVRLKAVLCVDVKKTLTPKIKTVKNAFFMKKIKKPLKNVE